VFFCAGARCERPGLTAISPRTHHEVARDRASRASFRFNIVFGTYYAAQYPPSLVRHRHAPPTSLIGQLVFPFRKIWRRPFRRHYAKGEDAHIGRSIANSQITPFY
jgi:hypothetical protein